MGSYFGNHWEWCRNSREYRPSTKEGRGRSDYQSWGIGCLLARLCHQNRERQLSSKHPVGSFIVAVLLLLPVVIFVILKMAARGRGHHGVYPELAIVYVVREWDGEQPNHAIGDAGWTIFQNRLPR